MRNAVSGAVLMGRWVMGGAIAAVVLAAGAGMCGVTARADEPVASVAAATQRTATVDVLMLVERVVLLPKFGDAMTAVTMERAKELQQIVDKQNELETQARPLEQTSEQFKALQAQYMTLDSQFKQRQSEVRAELDALTAKQLQQAYSEVVAAVDGLAKQRGYTHVLSSRRASEAFRAVDFPNTLQEMLARSVIVSPLADDVTEAMLDVLGVRGIDPAQVEAAKIEAAKGAAGGNEKGGSEPAKGSGTP